jgi:Kef-type K+ transport system membrane component KefB
LINRLLLGPLQLRVIALVPVFRSSWFPKPIRFHAMSDQIRLLFALAAATCVHVAALSQGFGLSSILTGDIHSQLRPLIVAQP